MNSKQTRGKEIVDNMNVKSLLVMSLIVGALALVACGGSSDSESGSDASGEQTAQAPPGGMPANFSEEDIQCLEDKGITLPERPEGAPEGEPPEGMPEGGPPEGMPEGGAPEGMPEGAPEGMEGLQEAMTECGIEMPEPPEGAPAPTN